MRVLTQPPPSRTLRLGTFLFSPAWAHGGRVVFTAEVTAGLSSRTQQEVIFGMWIVCVYVLMCICVSVLAYV